jgi:S-DNA-T family DNA segregation ATPase FtsK/SpoIIIE
MAKLNKATKTAASSKQPAVQATDRKKEILGVILMALASMLLVSIFTYHATDWMAVKESAGNLSRLESRIGNGLSLVGAYIAHFFVYQLLGYFSAIIPGIIGVAGWFTFRHKSLDKLWPPALKAAWTMLLLGIISGWICQQIDYMDEVYYGQVGLHTSQLLQLVLGFYGSLIVLIAALIITVLILFSIDVQTVINKLKELLQHYKEQRADKKEEKAIKKAEALAEKEAKKDNEEADNSDVAEVKEDLKDEEATPTQAKKTSSQVERTEDEEDAIQAVLAASRIKEKEIMERRAAEEAEMAMMNDKPRVILEKPINNDFADVADELAEQEAAEQEANNDVTDDGVEIDVYQGEEEAEAGNRALAKAQKEAVGALPTIKYKFPSLSLLDTIDEEQNTIDFDEIENNKRIILEKLSQHKIEILSIQAIVGPTVTLYEMQPAPHVKIGKIESYANDLKMATAAHGIRIIAPIPGKSAVGIEIPNQKRQTVSIKQVINTKRFTETDLALPVAFGKTIENELFIVDLAKMPHLLVAGATGSGKSVGINTIVTCLLYKCHPDNLKFVMIDPKKIELSLYRNIERHYLATLPHAEEPIVTDTSKALEILQSTTLEMDNRYDLLKAAGSRNIKEYNAKFHAGKLDPEEGHRHLPYIVVIIDELADLMMTAGKQIEEPIARLAQLARAIGIHLVVATQRPSVNVITGTIKANFPARIAYQVASKVDSRTILDSMGADQLVGKGDMLFSNGGAGGMIRIQNAFVSTEEVERVTDFIGNQAGYTQPYMLPVVEDEESSADLDILSDKDAMFEQAANLVVLHQQGSVSLIQRKLKLGYNRAGRIVDQLYAAGVVGPYKGSTAREVLIPTQEELDDLLRSL